MLKDIGWVLLEWAWMFATFMLVRRYLGDVAMISVIALSIGSLRHYSITERELRERS
jgi:hypothetical protein